MPQVNTHQATVTSNGVSLTKLLLHVSHPSALIALTDFPDSIVTLVGAVALAIGIKNTTTYHKL